MAKLKPWFKVVSPREDLREGRPLDAAEFAVHLDQVRDGRASADYQNPEHFFDRTYLTKNLLAVSAEIVRRLSGEKTEASAVFNMTTQFGGGKTHALTLLYHLATHGPASSKWTGVPAILERAGVKAIPSAATAVFVGTEFDSIAGRGGDDGTPKRMTPWGEIAYQLSGDQGFASIRKHDEAATAPSGEVIRKFLPRDKPSLILIDELMNFMSRSRKSGLSSQVYSFLHNLSEEARGNDRVVLVVSVPASELEMSSEDQSDYERIKKILDRLGKPVVMSAAAETSEIIRRRLFEWDSKLVSADGRILLSRDAVATCSEWANWAVENRNQIPSWFAFDHAPATFEASYPFHPMVLSVFERKWQELPRFQQTRGMLRLLALWVSHVYQEGYRGNRQDPLIGLGSAPMHESLFRSAVFEQLGESRLEGAVTTDIAGSKDSHAVRLDEEAVDTIRKAQIHRQVATAVFFESNGGQSRNDATLPEIRFDVAGPDVDIGNIETALEALADSSYYLITDRNRYRFSLKENLNKRYADRRASISADLVEGRIRDEIQNVFSQVAGVDRVFFPENSSQIPDRPAVTLVVLSPDQSLSDDSGVRRKIQEMTKEHGKSDRSYKSALLWVAADSASMLRDEARKVLAWEDIRDEGLKLDETQLKQLDISIKRARRDVTEAVWRTYKNVLLLGKDNELKTIDLGLVTSSAAESMTKLVFNRLKETGEIESGVSARFLIRNWSGAFTEWSTRAVRDAFYASPIFPRLLDAEAVKQTIAQGVSDKLLAYVGKTSKGYDPFIFESSMNSSQVEISDDVFIITADEARKHIEPPRIERLLATPSNAYVKPGAKQTFRCEALDQFGRDFPISERADWNATGGAIDSKGVYSSGYDEGEFLVSVQLGKLVATATVRIAKDTSTLSPPKVRERSTIRWSGSITPQKWSNFYMKVLTKFVNSGKVDLQLDLTASSEKGFSDQEIEEIKAALRGLGVNDDVDSG